MEELAQLQAWYAAQCDGDWEHSWGIAIGTLDNPGWHLRVDLVGTRLGTVPYERQEVAKGELEWMQCWVEDQAFRAAGGPGMLTRMLAEFFRWAGEQDQRG